MKQKLHNNFSKHEARLAGFTIIELLVVIAIMGLLAAVIFASTTSVRMKSRDGRRVSDIKQIQHALEFYFDVSRTYPDDIYAASPAGLAPTYIPVVPKDPRASAGCSGQGPTPPCNYKYADCADNTRYHLGADLEDTGAKALITDRDGNSLNGATPGVCGVNNASSRGFDGSNDAVTPVYDVAL